MSYFYNKDYKYIYKSGSAFSPTDLLLPDSIGIGFFNLDEKQKELIQTDSKGFPMIAEPRPNPFYSWYPINEKWELDHNRVKEATNSIMLGLFNRVNTLKSELLKDNDLDTNNKDKRILKQYLYNASLDYVKNNEDVSQELKYYAFSLNKTVEEAANDLIKSYQELNSKLIACDWYKQYIENLFPTLGEEYEKYVEYVKAQNSLTIDEIFEKMKSEFEAQENSNNVTTNKKKATKVTKTKEKES